jgi:hypothetical protein
MWRQQAVEIQDQPSPAAGALATLAIQVLRSRGSRRGLGSTTGTFAGWVLPVIRVGHGGGVSTHVANGRPRDTKTDSDAGPRWRTTAECPPWFGDSPKEALRV